MKRTLVLSSLLIVIFTLALVFSGCGYNYDDQGLKYTAAKNGTYSVSVGKATDLTAITIPATFNGKAVDSIDIAGFRDCTALTEITVPDSVLYVNDAAFSGCTSLKKVKLGSGVKKIGEYAFLNCPIEEIEFPESVTTIATGAFQKTALKTVRIPDSVTAITPNSFTYCKSLTEVQMGEGVKSIQSGCRLKQKENRLLIGGRARETQKAERAT